MKLWKKRLKNPAVMVICLIITYHEYMLLTWILIPCYSRRRHLWSVVKEGRQKKKKSHLVSVYQFLFDREVKYDFFLIILAEVGGIEFVHSLLNLDNIARLNRPAFLHDNHWQKWYCVWCGTEPLSLGGYVHFSVLVGKDGEIKGGQRRRVILERRTSLIAEV